MRGAVVLGGSGFVGATCAAVLEAAGWKVRVERTPRLRTSARSVPDLATDLERHRAADIDALAEALSGADVVVNAGGIPTTTAEESDELFGANSLLPGVVSAAAQRAGLRRFIHLSSIMVQGHIDPLDETMTHQVSTPYARSRALGERLLEGAEHHAAVILREPSVHGPARASTRSLYRIARSPLSSTAGRGDRPTPMVLQDNVGAAVEFLAAYQGEIPKVVLQPTEGITTGQLLELLGGRRPHHIPTAVAKPVAASLELAGWRSTTVKTLARGIELLWFGQGQKGSWLTEAGFVPPVGVEGWRDLGLALQAG